MTPFTTSKGEFLAVPDVIDYRSWPYTKNRLAVITLSGAHTIKFDHDFEIIGLSSDILKDEELAKKVVDIHEGLSYWDGVNDIFYVNYLKDGNLPDGHCDPTDSFQSLLDLHNITGNQLIIKKHG